MFRQNLRRKQGVLLRISLLIVLTALVVNGIAVLHHVAGEASAPVCEQLLSAHDDLVVDDATVTAGIILPASVEVSRHPQHDYRLSKLLYASIFHPPKR
ncbi:MAG: hypothetical protein WCJ56_07545 [bacterium]